MNIHGANAFTRLIHAAFFVLLTGCVSTSRPQVVTNDTRARLAKALLEAGDPASAAEAMKSPAMRENPSISNRLTDAEILIDAGQVDSGLNLAEAALAAGGNDTALALEVASLAVKANRFSKADQIYRTILSRHPDNIEAINGIAVVSAQSGRLPDAIATLRQALTQHPRDVATQNNLALMLLLDGQPAAAIPIFENLSRSAPSAQVEAALSAARAKMMEHAPVATGAADKIQSFRGANDVEAPAGSGPATKLAALPDVQPTNHNTGDAVATFADATSAQQRVVPYTVDASGTWSCPAACRMMHRLFDKQGQAAGEH
jgi:Flp pilus assembly protein TadD